MPNVVVIKEAEVCRLCIRPKELLIGWQGRQHSLRLSRGLEQLVALMRNPGVPLDYATMDNDVAVAHAKYQQFSAFGEIREHGLHAVEDYLPLPLSDHKTVKEIKQRLLSLLSEEAELEENSDYGRLDDIRDEKEALTNYLNEVYSPARMLRNFPDENQKQRKRVQKNLLRAIAAIEEVEPGLAAVFKAGLQIQNGIVFRAEALIIEVESL